MEQHDMVLLATALGGGVAGGFIAGLVMKKRSLGLIGNFVIGALGGGACAYILKLSDLIPAKADASKPLDVTAYLTSGGAGLAGGLVLIVLISIFKGKPKE